MQVSNIGLEADVIKNFHILKIFHNLVNIANFVSLLFDGDRKSTYITYKFTLNVLPLTKSTGSDGTGALS